MIDMKIGIVGSGINGSYLAWRLSEKHKVTLFEKRKTVGKEVCSGLVSKRIWNFIPENNKIVEHMIDEISLNFRKKKYVLDINPKMLVLDRIKQDQYILSLARENGVDVKLETEVKRVFQVKKMKPQLSTKNNTYEFDYIIGCDGNFSVVRESLGIRAPKTRLGIYTLVNKKSDSNRVETYPTENGFCWKIPRKNKIEYGVLEKPEVAKKTFEKFCRIRRIKPRKVKSYVVPSGLVESQKGKIALCGDAIGLTKPWSGGGVIWGLVACDILIKNFPNFVRYEEEVNKQFGSKMLVSRIFEKTGRFMANNFHYLIPKNIYFDGDWLF